MTTPEDWLRFHFERCKPWLEEALDAFPMQTHTIDHVWESLVDGTSMLWPAEKGACVARIEVYPTGLKVLHGWLAGGDLGDVQTTVRAIEEYARKKGCDAADIVGRRGWVKTLPGFREMSTVVWKDLRHGSV